MKQYKAIIVNISTDEKNRWFVEFTDDVLVCTQYKKDATVFFEEWDAESTLEYLNQNKADCYTLITL